MNSTEKWNLITAGYKRLYSYSEAMVQAEWEMYCTDLFDYKKILHEIDAQRHLAIGSKGTIIPDIILCKNGADIFDIELKQYSLPFNEAFEKQLISYLNQTHLSVGMIVCNKIYLYYYEYSTIAINKIEIPFEADNADGVALVEMITKDAFSPDKIKEFIEEKKRHEKILLEIRQTLTNDWIKNTVRARLSEQYSEADVESVLAGYVFKASAPSKTPVAPAPIVITPAEPIAGSDPVRERITPIIHQWCVEKTRKGEMNFLSDASTRRLVRFTTADLDVLLPYQDGLKSGWNNGRFYSYEIVNSKGKFKMWLALSNRNAPEQIRQAYSRIMKAIGSNPKKEDWEWWCIFSTPLFSYNENTTQEEIINALESQFAQIRANEKGLLDRL